MTSNSDHALRTRPAAPEGKIEEVRYTRVALEPPFDIIRARFVQQKFVPHAHEEFAIGVVEQGTGRLEHAHGVDVSPSGTLVIIPPGLAHAGCAHDSEGWSYRMLYLPVSWLARAAERHGFAGNGKPVFGRIVIDDPDLYARIVTLHHMLESGDAPLDVQQQGLDAMLDDLVLRHAITGSDRYAGSVPSGGVRAARDHIELSFTRAVTIEDLSRVAGLSPYYLIRAFRRAYGLPPYTYLEYLRVQRARQLIESGVSIVEAALQSGFSDQSHLTRRFKRTLGITPGVIARRARADKGMSRTA